MQVREVYIVTSVVKCLILFRVETNLDVNSLSLKAAILLGCDSHRTSGL